MPKESAYFKVDNLKGKRDMKMIKQELDSLSGVISVSVNQNKQRVAVDFDNTGVDCSKLENKMSSLGFVISESFSEEHIM